MRHFLQFANVVVSSSISFQSCWFLSLLKFLFKLKWRQKRMLKPRHDLQTSYFESSRLLTYFPLTEFCWTQQQPSHCFWHKLPFLTMCEKSWHELSWHLTHLLRSSKNSVEIESARPLSTNSTSFWEYNMLCHYTKCNRKISPTPCHFKSKSFSSTLRFWATFSVISSHFQAMNVIEKVMTSASFFEEEEGMQLLRQVDDAYKIEIFIMILVYFISD